MRSLTTFIVPFLSLTLLACGAPPTALDDGIDRLASSGGKADDGLVRDVGVLGYSDEPSLIRPSETRPIASLRIEGRARDEVKVRLRSVGGRPIAVLLDADFRILASGIGGDGEASELFLEARLAETATHYVLLADAERRPVSFTVSMSGRAAIVQCAADADCTMTKGVVACCTPTAANEVELASYPAKDCSAVRCPGIETNDIGAACVAKACKVVPARCLDGRQYAARDHATCIRALFECKAGLRAFMDDCGCGCEAE